jgi:hypothetical protein
LEEAVSGLEEAGQQLELMQHEVEPRRLHRRLTDLARLGERVVESCRTWSRSEVGPVLRLSPGKLPPVLVDGEELACALRSVLEEAVEQGGCAAAVEVEVGGESGRGRTVVITVRDWGGIFPTAGWLEGVERQPSGWSAMVEGRPRSSAWQVRHIVEKAGGTVEASCWPGQRGEVRFLLPAGAEDTPAEEVLPDSLEE